MSEELDPQEQAILDTLVEKALGPTPMPLELDVDSPALRNYAVARCAAAGDTAYRKKLATSKNKFAAADSAAKAFRQAMPPLCGYDNICDFIACVSYGILIGAIPLEMRGHLLYSARVALGIVQNEPGPPQPRRT